MSGTFECPLFYDFLKHSRCPHAILDKLQRVVAVLARMPKAEYEKDVIERVTAAFRAESENLPPPGRGYMRGKFHAMFAGISHGGGTPVRTLAVKGSLSILRNRSQCKP